MKLKVQGSSSKGNSYILESDSEALIIEAGVRFKDVKKALDFNVSKIVGLIWTHEHLDHSKYIAQYLNEGIDCYASEGTIKALNISSYSSPFLCDHGVQFNVGNFTIMPFKVEHDAAQPLGFLIYHPECGKILFLTDTFYSEYIFPGLNHIIVEANYCEHILAENKTLHPSVRRRIITNHMSIRTCKELLSANDLSKVRNIILIHLSDSNSNAKQFKEEIIAHTGKQVFIAEKGLEVNIDLKPF